MNSPGALWRYILADVLTDQVLHPALPLQDVEFGPQLCGPGALRAQLAPRFVRAQPELLQNGPTVVYAERAGQIHDGYLLWRAEPEGEVFRVEGAGWPSYLTHRYDLHGELNGRGPYVGADPCRIIRDVWAYSREAADGDIGVLVDETSSPARVGTAEQPITYPWWSPQRLGEIIDTHVQAADHPEYTHTVDVGPGGRPVRRVPLAYPRLGRRRFDISFATGVNIVEDPRIAYDYDAYANTVIGLGAGEGTLAVRSVDSVRDGRLRLESVLARTDVSDKGLLDSLTRTARVGRQQLGTVDQIVVRDHPAAPALSWQIGDDVRITVHGRWTDVDSWMRITGWTVRPASDTYLIDLEPSGSFTYGSTVG
ncbi:hypothetical protein OG618_37125 (plasmid) [Kitasatospora sp. NBC_01246]|uniref:hypothetical protein n=1 Tax=Kitasatospora sp. NBC_01246 TaxID=2903570 RepID=UPI002E33BE7A|nr:hypothetical protein [Kitasatospora sp. NBC_01246]